ncbi:MAG: tetratricopeptide repeat protein [Patescibacteria group bacterium]|nr:tetratricopeptide repeat protein [Patescibacteria group bacterium]
MERIFNKFIKFSIYFLVFFLPLFWLPFTFEAFEFNKQYLLLFLVSFIFFLWLAKMVLVDKEIRFRKTPLDIPVLIFLFLAILSAFFSVDKISSLFGFYGRFSDGLMGLLSLGILYFLITNNVTLGNSKSQVLNSKQIPNPKSQIPNITVKGIMKVFIWAVFFVILISYFSIFGVWGKLNNLISLPRAMLQRTFNPVAGSLEGLAVFLVIVTIFLIGKILVNETTSRLTSFFHWILLLAALGLLIIIDFARAWILILVTLIFFMGFALWKRIFRENVNRLLLPIFLIIIAFLFIALNPLKNIQIGTLQFPLPQEQVLFQGASWKIAFRAVTENIKAGFLGSGIGTFHYDFAKFKPVELNQTWLWQIRFDRPGNHISEILGTMGFLGLISYLVLIGFFLLISYFLATGYKKLKGDNTLIAQQLPLLITFLALVVTQFVYYQNTVLAFMFWLILGLSVVSWQKSSTTAEIQGGPSKEKIFSFKDFPELSLVFFTLLIILGFTILGIYFFTLKFYLADVKYAASIQKPVEERIDLLEKTINLNPHQPQYKTLLARLYLQLALSELAKPLAEQNQQTLSLYISRAITYVKGGKTNGTYVKGATELAPNQVSAWETLGMIYREIHLVASGALEWGIKAFERAINLERTNPVLHTELGKLYLASGNLQKAREAFEKAKTFKPDYLDASIQIALLAERENKLEEAIREMERMSQDYPFNTEVLFQLGRLYFNNNQIDEAISQFKRVIDLMPNHSNAFYSLGVAYQRKGQKEEAISAFEKVLELNPNNLDVIQKLEELRK